MYCYLGAELFTFLGVPIMGLKGHKGAGIFFGSTQKFKYDGALPRPWACSDCWAFNVHTYYEQCSDLNYKILQVRFPGEEENMVEWGLQSWGPKRCHCESRRGPGHIALSQDSRLWAWGWLPTILGAKGGDPKGWRLCDHQTRRRNIYLRNMWRQEDDSWGAGNADLDSSWGSRRDPKEAKAASVCSRGAQPLFIYMYFF